MASEERAAFAPYSSREGQAGASIDVSTKVVIPPVAPLAVA
jgi:hypothetical protein